MERTNDEVTLLEGLGVGEAEVIKRLGVPVGREGRYTGVESRGRIKLGRSERRHRANATARFRSGHEAKGHNKDRQASDFGHGEVQTDAKTDFIVGHLTEKSPATYYQADYRQRSENFGAIHWVNTQHLAPRLFSWVRSWPHGLKRPDSAWIPLTLPVTRFVAGFRKESSFERI